MPYADDPLPGRTGPYWRRLQHRTLPGERTLEELQLVNALRARLGLPPEGGPAVRSATARGGVPQHPVVQDILRTVLTGGARHIRTRGGRTVVPSPPPPGGYRTIEGTGPRTAFPMPGMGGPAVPPMVQRTPRPLITPAEPAVAALLARALGMARQRYGGRRAIAY